MCITFYSLIQCKLCLDITGIWRTEALLAGVGAIWAGESGWSCRPELCSRYEECSLMLKEGTQGSDLPSIEPRHIAGSGAEIPFHCRGGQYMIQFQSVIPGGGGSEAHTSA